MLMSFWPSSVTVSLLRERERKCRETEIAKREVAEREIAEREISERKIPEKENSTFFKF